MVFLGAATATAQVYQGHVGKAQKEQAVVQVEFWLDNQVEDASLIEYTISEDTLLSHGDPLTDTSTSRPSLFGGIKKLGGWHHLDETKEEVCGRAGIERESRRGKRPSEAAGTCATPYYLATFRSGAGRS